MAALREFHRILKPGGRFSIAEPIFRDDAFEASSLKIMVDSLPAGSDDRFFPFCIDGKLPQFPDTEEKIAKSPITNFGERDLGPLCAGCRFRRDSPGISYDVRPAMVPSWDVFSWPFAASVGPAA